MKKREFKRQPIQPTLFDIPADPIFVREQLALAREIIEQLPEQEYQQSA